PAHEPAKVQQNIQALPSGKPNARIRLTPARAPGNSLACRIESADDPGMAGSNELARITNLHQRLQNVNTAWVDWYAAHPPFDISPENLNVAAVLAPGCGLGHGPVNPNAFRARSPCISVDSNDALSVLRGKAIEAIRAAKNAIPGVKPLVADVLGSDWTTVLKQWLSELEAHGMDAKRTFPDDQLGTRCALVLSEIANMASQLDNADCTPLENQGDAAVEPDPIKGEWSIPMPKSKMAHRLGLSPRQFATFAKSHELRKHNRQLWQIRLDRLDAKTRKRIEGRES
ncbi:MAG: hypothetical protein L0Z53_21620, partial [Acidobacteriales bacterium]|nr:hypothetical protein [Terriglobales bacterium]